jgi:serine phosphatase RsbU (regulator of sigma subunit)
VSIKIQTSLIPKKPELEGFEITGYMKTAEEVGGDYYDIIITPNGSFALIGDVSGHGVTAGLFMMMAQTSIHSIILANPDKPPSWILARVNKILKNNIFLLDEFRFMSMQLLHFDKKSNIIYAGAHEDILVFRNKTKKVDEYKSPGFWLGIETEIESFLIDSKIKINKNDVILLFTDGVTEARVPGKKIFFSKEKLVGILEKSGELSTNEIRNNILKELKDYEQKDDITFLILKKT